MPVQVEDIIPEEAAQEAPPQEEAQEDAQEEAIPAPKRRGRPPGSKNKPKPPAGEVQDIEEVPKPKPPAQPVRLKRAVSRKVVVREESESESEDEPPPPSLATQRKEQWAYYRRAQVEAHQARTDHYIRALDRVLGF